MNQETVLAVLTNSPETAKSMKEIAQELGLDISSHAKWVKAERSICRVLRKLVKWGLVTCDNRQYDIGYRFWYSAYWRIEFDIQKAEIETEEITAS